MRQLDEGGLPLLSDLDLFCRAVDEPIYAVTGTNGKSTVATLAEHLLQRLNHRPGVGGNLGIAALDLIAPDRDCYVLELSSFQLERMQTYPYRAATILNISPDHLDHHGGLTHYASAKQRIYRKAARLIANRDDPATLPVSADSARLHTFGAGPPPASGGHWNNWGMTTDRNHSWIVCGEERVAATDSLPLNGRHNTLNLMAALALIHGDPEFCSGLGPAMLCKALQDYSGLAHRCETVRRRHGVTWINDSKATNPGATLAAITSLAPTHGNLLLIAGGSSKDADFTPLGDAIAEHVRYLITLGEEGPAIRQAVTGRTPVTETDNLAQAVRRASELAGAGDTVLLSPACASFDSYRNYAQRGEAFRTLVQGLVA